MAALREHIMQMASYHAWATTQLLEALSFVSDQDFREEVGLFFGSIHGTLNHLLLAERLWMARMRGESMQITGLDQELEPARLELCHAVSEMASAWAAWITTWDESRLLQRFSYQNTEGASFEARYSDRLAHLFNHGTHHRGQITAAMTHLGYPGPALDLLYFQDPAA